MADKVKTKKTFIVQKTYEIIVQAYDRDGAIFEACDCTIDDMSLVSTKCGTPKQLKRTDVE